VSIYPRWHVPQNGLSSPLALGPFLWAQAVTKLPAFAQIILIKARGGRDAALAQIVSANVTTRFHRRMGNRWDHVGRGTRVYREARVRVESAPSFGVRLRERKASTATHGNDGVHRPGRTSTSVCRNTNNLNGLGFKHLVDIEGVTGSIPVAPTTHTL
jgi:hypothetical protein